MRRLGIAIVVYNIDVTGGMERQALRLAEQLARRGARVSIVSTYQVLGFVPRLPARVPFVERRGRLAIVRVPLCFGWKWVWCLAFYELAIAWFLATRARLDAIYAVQWSTGVQAERVARFLGAPLLVKFAGGGKNGDFAALERSPGRAQAVLALARATGLVCVSPQIADEARAAGLPPEKLLRIPNGVDLARFEAPAPAALREGERVLFVGALRREKRLPELVRAFAAVAKARPRARLVLAGDGPEEAAIRAAAREVGLEDRVDLLGRRSDVPELLAAAQVFVLTSESEGLSNALLEALAAGAPVVATDIEGNRAVVEHEKEALLVPLGDDSGLARAVTRLLEDRALAARLVEAGRAKVQAYSFERVAQAYEQAFRAVARPRPTSLGLAGRYLTRFENGGVTGLARAFVRYALRQIMFHVRRRISIAVVAIRARAGIPGAGMPPEVAPPPDEAPPRPIAAPRPPSRRKPGVAFLVDDFDATGGMERQARLLAREVAARGRRVVVVTGRFQPGAPGRLVERRGGVLVVRIPYFAGLDYLVARRLFETIAALVVRRFRGRLGAVYGVQAATAGPHAARIGAVTGLGSIVKVACSGDAGDFARIARERRSRETLAALARATWLVCLNEESWREAAANGISRIAAIPNGVDLARFDGVTPAQLPGLGSELVLFVGRLERQKRVTVLLEAFARVLERRPAARLALVGDGPDRDALEAQARELGGSVVFLGRRSDVPALLAAAAVFVLPSAEEGQSNALLEALAARVPVVATAIPGNEALVAHEREALLVPVDDAVALAAAIERVLVDPALARRLAEGGRERVAREHAIARVADAYLELVDALPRGPMGPFARFELARLAELAGWAVRTVGGRALRGLETRARALVSALVVGGKRAMGLPPRARARAREGR